MKSAVREHAAHVEERHWGPSPFRLASANPHATVLQLAALRGTEQSVEEGTMQRSLVCCAVLFLSACSIAGAMGHTTVTAERLEPGGKGLFVVRPYDGEKDCAEAIKGTNGAKVVDCNSEFLVGCDATTPDGRPFCVLMKEKGLVRDSIYPAGKRAP